jgi:hypothetical protein
MRTEIVALIAKVEHRLDQLTRPMFERDVVEELIKEIKLLEGGGRTPRVAKEIADCHNRIDELDDENEELAERLVEARSERDSWKAAALASLGGTRGQLVSLAEDSKPADLFPLRRHPSVHIQGQVLNGPPPIRTLEDAKKRLMALAEEQAAAMRAE